MKQGKKITNTGLKESFGSLKKSWILTVLQCTVSLSANHQADFNFIVTSVKIFIAWFGFFFFNAYYN